MTETPVRPVAKPEGWRSANAAYQTFVGLMGLRLALLGREGRTTHGKDGAAFEASLAGRQ